MRRKSMTSTKMQRQDITQETRLVKVRDTSFQWSKVSLVQDCSRTGNNNELRKGQRSRRKQLKQTKEWICWHKISREEPFQAAWRSLMSRETDFRPRESVSSSREIRHQGFNFARNHFCFARDRNGFAQDRMFSRETDMISRETKRCRAKVQTSFADSKQF